MTDTADELPPPVRSFEVCSHFIDLVGVGPDQPVALPAGWQPWAVARQSDQLVLLLVREVV